MFLMLPCPAKAADWSLPLNGYYRLGRYMPVQFGAANHELRFSADGVFETSIPTPAGGVAPCLISRAPSPDLPFASQLQELASNQKIVGLTADFADAGSRIFPDASIVSIRLDPTRPLKGSIMAWQTLDAVVLDASALSSLKFHQIAFLLDGGTSLALPAASDKPPNDLFPWRLENGLWLLRSPAPPVVDARDQNLAPIAQRPAGRSKLFRANLIWMALLWAIFVLLASLKLSKQRILLPLNICLLATAAAVCIGIWDDFQSPIRVEFGFVYIPGDPSMRDCWSFNTAIRACNNSTPASGFVLPIISHDGGPRGMTIVCGPTGEEEEFQYRLERDDTAEFLYRDAPFPVPLAGHHEPPLRTPLRLLPPSIYPGFAQAAEMGVERELQPYLTEWPSLVLAKSDAIPKNLTPSSTRDSSNK